jgi:hypothetical protein
MADQPARAVRFDRETHTAARSTPILDSAGTPLGCLVKVGSGRRQPYWREAQVNVVVPYGMDVGRIVWLERP